MLGIRQRYWFCLAAVCLVGSLILLWSSDIEIAEEVAKAPLTATAVPVLRSLDELPTTTDFADKSLSTIELGRVFAGNDAGQVRIQAPAAVAGRMASPMNTTARVIPADQVSTAAFHQSSNSAPEPVWLTGNIETVEFTN